MNVFLMGIQAVRPIHKIVWNSTTCRIQLFSAVKNLSSVLGQPVTIVNSTVQVQGVEMVKVGWVVG